MSRKLAANHFSYFTLASTVVRSFWSGSSRFFLLTQGSTTWTVGSVKGFFHYIFFTLDLLDNKRDPERNWDSCAGRPGRHNSGEYVTEQQASYLWPVRGATGDAGQRQPFWRMLSSVIDGVSNHQQR